MSEYDSNNILAKILLSEIPCKKIYEDDDVLCFEDVAQAAPVHLLVIPKQRYTCFEDFVQNANPIYVANFFTTIAKIAQNQGVNKTGYRLATNNGGGVGQTIFHFHIHLLAGKKMTGLAL